MDSNEKKSFKKFLKSAKENSPFLYIYDLNPEFQEARKETGTEPKDEDEKEKEQKESLLKFLMYVNQAQ